MLFRSERHLVEVAFSESAAESELFLGGHPATPAWNRPWPGRVYEAVFLESAPQGDSRDALRAYLSLKWDSALMSRRRRTPATHCVSSA